MDRQKNLREWEDLEVSNQDIMYAIWCEWDIGQENSVYSTKEKAIEAAKELWTFQNMDEEVGISFFDAFSTGLINVFEYKVY